FKTGRRTTLIDQATGGDLAIYDDKVDRFFVAQPGAHGGSQVAIFDGSPIKYRTAVAVPSIGGGVAYDQAHDLVYATDVQPGKAGLITVAQSEAIEDFEGADGDKAPAPAVTSPRAGRAPPLRSALRGARLVHAAVNPPFARRPPFFVNARLVGLAAAVLAGLA